MNKLWFSIFDDGDYKGTEPPFFNPEAYDFAKLITGNFKVIEQELHHYLETHQLQSYFNEAMVAKKDSWKTISLKTWNVELYENYRYFPKTLAIIQSVPAIVSASFNLLEPHGHIVPHHGDTNGIFRCHLGLSIPAQVPVCGFRVKEEWRSWEEGKLLVFVDANNHEAINSSEHNRFIFLFDVIRDEFQDRKKTICATVITSLFLQKWAQAIPTLHKVPLWLRTLTVKALFPFVYVAIPVRNFLYQGKK